MLYLTAQTKICVAVEPIDFRKQMDGLIALCEQRLQQYPRSGDLFVFINRSRTMIRVLCYETNGYWLATKRLSQGRYKGWPKRDGVMCRLDSSELSKILKKLIESPKNSE